MEFAGNDPNPTAREYAVEYSQVGESGTLNVAAERQRIVIARTQNMTAEEATRRLLALDVLQGVKEPDTFDADDARRWWRS